MGYYGGKFPARFYSVFQLMAQPVFPGATDIYSVPPGALSFFKELCNGVPAGQTLPLIDPSDGTEGLVLPLYSTLSARFLVTARRHNDGASAVWEFLLTARRQAGVAEILLPSSTIAPTFNDIGASIELSVEVDNTLIRLPFNNASSHEIILNATLVGSLVTADQYNS